MGKPKTGIAWSDHIHEGRSYSLKHLHPHQWDVTVPARKGFTEKTVSILVSYSIHCFTRGIKPGEQVKPESLYSDSRESRVFDTQRWHLSHHLPEIILSLESRRCVHSDGEEFITVEFIENGEKVEYAIFFTVSRGGKSGADLNLFVNSAHKRTELLRHKKPIRFHIILMNRYRNKAIKPPP